MNIKDLQYLKETPITMDKIYNYNPFRGSSCPIIIDNGAYHCRVGFANQRKPKMIFRNLICKQRAKKEPEIIVGNDITNLEAVKWLLRSPFESNVITLFDVQEIIFDHIFTHLGIDTSSVEHPIVINEPLCVPLCSRSNMEELLFECYQIPSLMIGIDALFSLFNKFPNIENCLVISLGHYTCHVIAIIDGKLDAKYSSRINLGGFNLTLYLQRLLQLKYPKHTQEFTFTKCEYLVQNCCKFSANYDEESVFWADEHYYEKNANKFKTLNFDATKLDLHSKSEHFSITCQRLISKVESNLVNKREKQLIELEEQRKKLKTLLDLVEDEELADPVLITRAYHNAGVKNLNELRLRLNELNYEIKITKAKLTSKQEQEKIVLDEIKEWQQSTTFDEIKWISYIRDLRLSNLGENAWILNELLREYDLEMKRLKRHGVSDNIIEIGSESIRVPELLFSPHSLINYPQNGITQMIEQIIQKLDRTEISENIYLTGGCANIEGLVNRIQTDVTSLRPFKSNLSINIAENPSLDSWNGSLKCVQQFQDKFITKNDYLEFGSNYIKEHRCGNILLSN